MLIVISLNNPKRIVMEFWCVNFTRLSYGKGREGSSRFVPDTHLFPVIQTNTNLSAAVKGFLQIQLTLEQRGVRGTDPPQSWKSMHNL